MMSARHEEPLPEDATYIGDFTALSDAKRGAILQELTVQFDARADKAHWSRLLEELKLETRSVDDERMAGFISLPARSEPLMPYLTGEIIWSARQPDLATWTFQWARSPEEPPPEEIRALGALVGDFPAVLDKLGAQWPTTAPLEAEVSAGYLILPGRRLHGLPSHKGKKLRLGEREVRVTPTHWKLEPPNGPVREILGDHPKTDIPYLAGRGVYTFRWTPRFLNEVDGAIWGGLKDFLELS
jgi:hypothetical protein